MTSLNNDAVAGLQVTPRQHALTIRQVNFLERLFSVVPANYSRVVKCSCGWLQGAYDYRDGLDTGKYHLEDTKPEWEAYHNQAYPLSDTSEARVSLHKRVRDAAQRLQEETQQETITHDAPGGVDAQDAPKDPAPAYYLNSKGVNLDEFVGELDMRKGNIIKYVYRAGNKPGTPKLKDLHKARHVLDLLIQATVDEATKTTEENTHND